MEEKLQKIKKHIIEDVGSKGFDEDYLDYLKYVEEHYDVLSNYFDGSDIKDSHQVMNDYYRYLDVTEWYKQK